MVAQRLWFHPYTCKIHAYSRIVHTKVKIAWMKLSLTHWVIFFLELLCQHQTNRRLANNENNEQNTLSNTELSFKLPFYLLDHQLKEGG